MSEPRSCWKCCLLWVSAGLLTLFVAFGLLFVGAASWLNASVEPRPSDAIVVLAGSPERARYAADLYLREFAPTIYVSRPKKERGLAILEEVGIHIPPEDEINRRVLEKHGVPASAIRFYGDGIVSTFEEAQKLKELLSGKAATMLVVTSPHHVRRAGMIFDRVFENTQVRFLVVATPYERLPEPWWRDQEAARHVLLETAKIAYFIAGGRFVSAP